MLYRFRRYLGYSRFNRTCRAILDSKPLRPSIGEPIIVSMVSRRDFLPYLIAAKSFYAQLGRGRFHVVDDGTMTPHQRKQLRWHLDANIVAIDAVPAGPTPRGGTWERLLQIADLVADAYVVQLDSDTLTLGALPEIERAIEGDASFTLITHPNIHYCTVAERCAIARADPATDIHTIAEQCLDVACDPQRARYVHGCSGFAGFARRSFTREDLYRFSVAMEGRLGRRWWEWGSEQITSNFFVSNAARLATIPYPRYRNFEGEPLAADTAFTHFIGTHRFDGGIYARTALTVVQRLLNAQ